MKKDGVSCGTNLFETLFFWSASVFILVKRMVIKNKVVTSIISTLSRNLLGIYACYMLFVFLFWSTAGGAFTYLAVEAWVRTAIVLFCSIVLTEGLRKIPVLSTWLT